MPTVEYSDILVVGSVTQTQLVLEDVPGNLGDLLVLFAGRNQQDSTVDTASYGSSGLALVSGSEIISTPSSGNAPGVSAWFLVSPGGTEDVTVDFNGSGFPAQRSIGVAVISDVNTSSPFRTVGSDEDEATNALDGSVSAQAGDLVLSAIQLAGSRTLSAGTDQTIIEQAGTSSTCLGVSRRDGAATTAFGWTWGSGSTNSVLVMVPIVPASVAPAGPPIGSLSLLGVGR